MTKVNEHKRHISLDRDNITLKFGLRYMKISLENFTSFTQASSKSDYFYIK